MWVKFMVMAFLALFMMLFLRLTRFRFVIVVVVFMIFVVGIPLEEFNAFGCLLNLGLVSIQEFG